MKKSIPFLFLSLILTSFSFAQKNDVHPVTINFTVNSSDWKAEGKPDSPGGYMVYRQSTDLLTKNVFDSAMVMVYVLGTSGGGWYPLPHSYYTSGVEVTTTFNYQPGHVELRTYNAANSQLPFNVSMRYKLVILQ